MTPSLRQHANKMTKHHMLYEKPQWSNGKARNAWELGAYQMQLPRHWHDRLHVAVKPLPIPHPKVLDVMVEVGKEYDNWKDDSTRMDRIVDTMIGFAIGTHSPEQADDMLQVATSIEAQMGVHGLWRSMRPQR